METVQLQCGNCKQIMGISAAHLGGQVQCPHCRSVVQTPPAAAPSPVPNVEARQRESIFTGAEATDDLFGGDQKVKVELPSEPPPAVNHQPAHSEALPPPAMYTTPQLEAGSDADLTQFKRRPLYDKGVIQMSILIFLVPYAILTTLIIVYLLFFHAQGRNDPFQFLPDPASSPKKGGPQPSLLQPKHDQPLAANLRTTLKKPIKVGDLIVTPERVHLTEDGDLELYLRARNDSAKTKFEPINDSFVRYTANKAGNEPYTFLESRSKKISNVYGGFLEYRKSFNGKKETPDSYVISPHEEAYIVLMTHFSYRAPHVTNIAKSNDEFTWRIQVRRGFVKVKGKDVSATAVIGVDFSAADIEREGKHS